MKGLLKAAALLLTPWQGTRVPMAPHLLCHLSLSVPGFNYPGVTHGTRSLHCVAVLSPKLITAAV